MKIVRAPSVRIVDRGDRTTIIGTDGAVRQLEGDSAELVRAILNFVAVPREWDALIAHLTELAGETLGEAQSVKDAVALLRSCGVVTDSALTPKARAEHGTHPRHRIVLGLTGAVATMHAPAWVARLLQRGFDVRIATTRRALRFVRAESLELLTHNPVCSSMWQRDEPASVPHINLAEWADVVLIYPASATTISRIAAGNFQDLVSAIAITTRAPVIIAPSMNVLMHSAPSVQRNMATLRQDGFYCVHPGAGIEVADRPDLRAPMFGPAPPFEDVLSIVSMALAERHSAGPHVPTSAREWDELYATNDPSTRPWQRDTIDDDTAAALGAPRGSTRLLDIGTGTGSVAIEAARRGFETVATDLSRVALEIARRRTGAERVTWLVDDVLSSRVQSRFDVIHDRGCLHMLSPEHHRTYCEAATRMLLPGGRLIVKVHGDALHENRGTHRFTRDQITRLFEPTLELVSLAPSTMPGPNADPPLRGSAHSGIGRRRSSRSQARSFRRPLRSSSVGDPSGGRIAR